MIYNVSEWESERQGHMFFFDCVKGIKKQRGGDDDGDEEEEEGASSLFLPLT